MRCPVIWLMNSIVFSRENPFKLDRLTNSNEGGVGLNVILLCRRPVL